MNKSQVEAIKTLKKSRSLLNKKTGWTKGIERGRVRPDNKLSSNGDVAAPRILTTGMFNDETPDTFCAFGALRYADGPGEKFAIQLLKQAIRVVRGFHVSKKPYLLTDEGIFRFNDSRERTKAEVLAAFDKAIELAPTLEYITWPKPKAPGE